MGGVIDDLEIEASRDRNQEFHRARLSTRSERGPGPDVLAAGVASENRLDGLGSMFSVTRSTSAKSGSALQ
jgi:hypothetical protein